MKTVQRIDLGLQGVEQAPQKCAQCGVGFDRRTGRHETGVELEAASGVAANAAQRLADEMVTRLVVGLQPKYLLQHRSFRFGRVREEVG